MRMSKNMTSTTVKKFIELLEKEEGQALELSRRLDLKPSTMTNVILRRLVAFSDCVIRINKNRLRNKGRIKFLSELSQGLKGYDSNINSTTPELIRELKAFSLELESLISRYKGGKNIGVYMIRTLGAYILLLKNLQEDHERKVKFYAMQ